MILWDRIKRSFDDGVETVVRVSSKLSERARIETAVARLLIDKGSLETRAARLNQRLGERVYSLWELKSRTVMRDHEVLDTLKEIAQVMEEIASLQSDINSASLGKEGD